MKKWIACLLVCCAIASLSGCKKDTVTSETISREQEMANLEDSKRELEEFAKKTKENLERVKQQNQDYLDAYAKASGKK